MVSDSVLVQFVYDCLPQLDGSKMRKFCGKYFWKLASLEKDLKKEDHMVRTILFQNVSVHLMHPNALNKPNSYSSPPPTAPLPHTLHQFLTT